MLHAITKICNPTKITLHFTLLLVMPHACANLTDALADTRDGPVALAAICNNAMCECEDLGFECRLKDKFSLILIEGNSFHFSGVFRINITCVYEPKDLSAMLSEKLEITLDNTVTFNIKNCFTLPALLRQSNISYAGTVEFDQNVDAPADFFRHARQLKQLIMPVKFIYVDEPLPAQLFHNLTNLRSLHLIAHSPHVQISWPVQLFHTLYNLEALNLEMVALHTTLHGMSSAHFRDLRALKQLKLDGNFMMTLEADLFTTLTELNRLSLCLNGLEELPQNLLRMQRKLIVLDLSSNRLQTLPAGLFANTPLLWELSLWRNRLSVPTNIIENVYPLSYLYKLDLSENKLETIWGTGVYSNRSLLSRSHRSDPYALANFRQMAYGHNREESENDKPLNYTDISLRTNRITNFTYDWIAEAGIKCPYFFNFAHNLIRNMHAILRPSAFGCQRDVYLLNNPLVCDCELAWIYNTDVLVSADYWTCDMPSHLNGGGLQNLQRTDLCAWSPAWCPEKCICVQQENMLVINCSHTRLQSLTQLPRPEQLSLTESALHLEHNLFYELPSNATFGYAKVTRLYASHNRLNIVLSSHLPPQLVVLDVRANQLQRLSDGFLRNYLNESATLQTLQLADNPWLCDCEAELLLYTLRAQRARIPDIDALYCANFPNVSLLNVTFAELCVQPTSSIGLMTRLLALFSAILTLLCLITLYYKYELEVKIWLHANNLALACFSVDELDKHKTFDAFISYSHKEEHYVNRILLPGLENGVPPFRICTHERNWLAGAYIPEQIVESVEQSRRTIIVLSQHFIESVWGRMEFRTAHQCAVNEGRARIIIIKYGEITNMAGLDSELEAHLRMHTYLESDDTKFWQKLRYAMPHKRGEGRKAGMLEVGGRFYLSGQVELNQLKEGQ